MSLGELNKNITKQGISLRKIASGMRINGAQDDASGYAISEKMRVMIRGLDQDEKNVKNGSSLLNVAAGGIDNIVDELRNLKELALNAANDSNTDADRATIQKEFDQKMVNINDIASETNYNGKLLLNGDYYRPYTYWGQTYTKGNPQTTTIVVGQRLESIQIGTRKVPMNGVRQSVPNKIQGIAAAFTFGDNTVMKSSNPQSVSPAFKNSSKVFSVEGSTYSSSQSSLNGLSYVPEISAKMDFSGITKTGGGTIDIPSDLDGQGFSILCRDCSAQFVTIKFDINTTGSSCVSGGSTGQSYTYNIGIKDVTSIDKLPEAVFNGIKNASSKPTPSTDSSTRTTLDTRHNLRIEKDGNNYYIKKNDAYGAAPPMGIYDAGTIQDIFYSEEPIYEDRLVDVTKTITTYSLVPTDTWIFDPGRPLVIHHGTKANQALNVYINDMHTDAMGLTGTQVTTQKKASDALEIIDNALEYTLNEATNIGAYISRLEFTEDNIVTANENTTDSESTIRDADMAKEMVEYTKNNVIAQASQSMLAQANQNLSSVLSLLQ